MHDNSESWEDVSHMAFTSLLTYSTQVFPGRPGAAIKRKYYDLELKDQQDHYKKRRLFQEVQKVTSPLSHDTDESTSMIGKEKASDHSEELRRQTLPLLPLEQTSEAPCPEGPADARVYLQRTSLQTRMISIYAIGDKKIVERYFPIDAVSPAITRLTIRL
jgi:hypothetical protein